LEELLDKIRNGDETEAREIVENLQKAALKGAVVSIVSRNMSHGIGTNAITALKKRAL
jgi:hypothetical protein